MENPKSSIIGVRSVRAMFATAAGLAMLAGCTSGASITPSPDVSSPAMETTSAGPSSPVPATLAKQAALTAYQGMWSDFADAATTSDWQSPKLGQFATGLALSTISRGLYADHYNGLVARGAPVLHPSVYSETPLADPTTVMIRDCGDSTHWLEYKASTGQLDPNSPGGHRLINATVQKQADGSWKVTDFGIQNLGSC